MKQIVRIFYGIIQSYQNFYNQTPMWVDLVIIGGPCSVISRIVCFYEKSRVLWNHCSQSRMVRQKQHPLKRGFILLNHTYDSSFCVSHLFHQRKNHHFYLWNTSFYRSRFRDCGGLDVLSMWTVRSCTS